MLEKKESYDKYKAFPFKKKSDRPSLPVWMQADPEAKKRWDKIKKSREL